jgi:NhaA family Na+:H+ antiporter
MTDEEPRRGQALSELGRYLRTETVGGIVLLAVTAVALAWANSPWSAAYRTLRDLSIGPAGLHLDLTVGQWATDGLLALFFFVAGLELKRELTVGELSHRKTAVLPVIAALGGVVVPAGVAAVIIGSTAGAGRAWAIPMATDIAFALAVLAVVGSHLPASARVFLLSLATVDDVAAIAVVAVVFAASINLLALAAAAALCGAYLVLQRNRVTSPLVYVPVAVATWAAVHAAGVHATIAGVALAMLTRVRADPGEQYAPALRLEHRLQPWSAGFAVPTFALFAAGIPVTGNALTSLVGDRVAFAVIVGLLAGKLVGITSSAWLATRLHLAAKPADLSWTHMTAVAILGGVGFTVSLLIADLSLTGPPTDRAKAAVLIASATAALLAAALLAATRRRDVGRGR